MHFTTSLLTLLAAARFASANGWGWYALPPGIEAGSASENPFAPQRPSEKQASIHFEDGSIGKTFLIDTKTLAARLMPEDARWVLQKDTFCAIDPDPLSGCQRDPR